MKNTNSCERCDSIFYKRQIGIMYRGEYICKGCYERIIAYESGEDEEEDDYDGPYEIRCEGNYEAYFEDDEEAESFESDEPEAEVKKMLTPKEIVAELDKNIIGQDEAKKLLSVAIYKHCKQIESGAFDVKLPKSNILMKGPTGSGKTYLLQNIARLLDVPFCIADASNLTAAGYKGNNVDTILHSLIQAADGNIKKAEKGIVYLDEFDKLSGRYDVKNDGSAGVGATVQRQLLKMIEGCVVDIPKALGRETDPLDTKDILFICGGAFVDMDKPAEEGTKSIGFCVGETVTEEEKKSEVPTADDFIKFGLIPEIVGRLPVIVNLNKLTVEDMKKIITDSGESFLKGYKELMKNLGVELVFQDDAIEEIAQQAYDRGVGARGINALIEGVMQDIMFEIPSDPTITKCVVSREAVRGEKEPYIIRTGKKMVS